jgi:hypothetical protein
MTFAALFARPVRDVRKTAPLEAGGRVYIENSGGSIQITAWNRNQVEVQARIEPRTFLGSQRACVVETDVRLDAWPRSVRITPAYAFVDRRIPRVLAALFGECTEQPLVHYRISVPRTAELVIVNSGSKVSLKGLEGRVEVRPVARQ